MTDHTLIAVAALRPGMHVDLEGDRIAALPRPNASLRDIEDHASTVELFQYEYQRVDTLEIETDDCIVVHFDHTSIAFPPAHKLPVNLQLGGGS